LLTILVDYIRSILVRKRIKDNLRETNILLDCVCC